jgi:hypothetical protein
MISLRFSGVGPLPALVAGWSSPVARQAHNLKVTGSNPVPATNDVTTPPPPWLRGSCAFRATASAAPTVAWSAKSSILKRSPCSRSTRAFTPLASSGSTYPFGDDHRA